ncbi:MAG: LPS-assembly protein LptD, partial [Nitrospiria bacterium]
MRLKREKSSDPPAARLPDGQGRQVPPTPRPVTGRARCLASLVLFLILFLPGISTSQDQPGPAGRIPVPDLGKLSKGKEPINITADQLEYRQKEDVYTADGHVVVTQGGLHLTGDHVVLENATGFLTADGHVELLQGEDLLKADRMEFNVNTSQGVVYKGRIDTRKDNYHIEGERMERLSEQVYLIDEGSLTTCDVCEGSAPAWRFRAKKLRLRLDHYAVAKGVVFDIKDIPVVYLPYLVFPVKTTRQSGFLLPRIGYGTKDEGFKYLQPFYWAIGNSHDATLSFDYWSARGIGGVLEYRYVLSRVSKGIIDSFYFHDRDLKTEYLALRYHHTQQFTERLDLKADITYLNPTDVLKELSSITAWRAQTSSESNLFIHHRTDLHSLSFLTRYTQNLLESNDQTLQHIPELDYTLTEFPVGKLPILLGGDFSAVNFWRNDELENPTDPSAAKIRAFRADLFPKLWRPFELGGLATLTPQAGFRETYYSRGVQNHKPVHREIPYGALDLKSPWIRHYGTNTTHLVDSVIQYEYADLLQKETVPQFDQVDLAPQKDLITYSLTNRLRIGDGSALLRLTHSYNLIRSDRELSDLRAQWEVQPGDWLSVDLDTFYNIYDERFSAINTDAVLRWSPFFETSAGQRYTRQGSQSKKGDIFNPISLGERINQAQKIEFLTAGANLYLPWPIDKVGSGNGLYLATKGYYNLDTHGFAEIDYGLKYSAQCWEFVVDYKDFPDKNEISFLITL